MAGHADITREALEKLEEALQKLAASGGPCHRLLVQAKDLLSGGAHMQRASEAHMHTRGAVALLQGHLQPGRQGKIGVQLQYVKTAEKAVRNVVVIHCLPQEPSDRETFVANLQTAYEAYGSVEGEHLTMLMSAYEQIIQPPTFVEHLDSGSED